MMEKTERLILLVSLIALLAACEAVKSSNPLSPSIAGPIPGVNITAPRVLEPGSGWSLDNSSQPVKLLLENASTNGQRPLTYTFEVASDTSFNTIVFSRAGIAQGDGGRTSLQMSDRLPTGRTFYWRAKAEDGANAGPYSAPAGFSIVTPVIIDVPAPLDPIGGARIGSTRPTFKVGNAPHSGPTGQIADTIQVASDGAFAAMVAIYNIPETSGQTQFAAPLDLPFDQAFYWRVRAYDTGSSGVVGNWSAAQTFRTALAPPPPPPPPAPSPSPSPSPGGTCTGSSPLPIIQCERNKYGHMDSGQIVTFLSRVAHDLNVSGISGGPFGILHKTSGNNCNGYSCDIICTGASAVGWDTLGDSDGAQIPQWSGPIGVPAGQCQVIP